MTPNQIPGTLTAHTGDLINLFSFPTYPFFNYMTNIISIKCHDAFYFVGETFEQRKNTI